MGGGTGTFVLLSGLKHYKNLSLTAIISATDDGGSNKKFRDEFGLIPPSDFRQCLVALADEDVMSFHGTSLLRELFMYRFNKGEGFKGQTFGNMFIAALADILGSQIKAMEEIGKILHIKGRILPITVEDIRLVAEYEDGMVVKGEHLIDEPENIKIYGKRISKLSVDKDGVKLYNPSRDAIRNADFIILGPGDLYTSTLANIVVGDTGKIIKNSKAKFVYIMNLMSKRGQTDGYTAQDHIDELYNYIGRYPDFVIINNSAVDKEIIEWYKGSGEVLIEDDLKEKDYHVVRADLIGNTKYKKSVADSLKRSVLRHDSDKLARVVMSIVTERE